MELLFGALSAPDMGDILARIAAAVVLGAMVGAERQWRSKAAGLRTTALVSVGAALFTALGAAAFDGGDPTRVSAQIVSGIGFLGGGVIIKHGSSITGLNTAATMWAAAAVGALAGAGAIVVALIGAVLIVATNITMRPVARVLERSDHCGREAGECDYSISVRGSREAEMDVRSSLFDAVSSPGLQVRRFRSHDADDDPEAELVLLEAVVHARERDDALLERALASLVPHPQVTGVKWSVNEN